jgi:hypothetical protein
MHQSTVSNIQSGFAMRMRMDKNSTTQSMVINTVVFNRNLGLKFGWLRS